MQHRAPTSVQNKNSKKRRLKNTLKKVESAIAVDANEVNSYGLAYSAMTISKGWPKANQKLITQCALNSGLITMLIGLADGMAEMLGIDKLLTLRKDYRSLNASLGTFVFSLRAVIAAWVYVSSDFGNNDEDVYASNRDFFILVGAMGLVGCLKFVNDLLNNHEFLAKKKESYENSLSLISAMMQEHDYDEDTTLSSRAETYTKKIRLIEKLQKVQSVVNALFVAFSGAGSLVNLGEFSAQHVFQTDLKKHYVAQGICYVGSLIGGTSMAVASHKFPERLLKALSYMNAVLMLTTLIESYTALQKDNESSVNAQILLGLWSLLLAVPLITQSVRYCSKKEVDPERQRLISIEEVEDENNTEEQEAPQQTNMVNHGSGASVSQFGVFSDRVEENVPQGERILVIHDDNQPQNN